MPVTPTVSSAARTSSHLCGLITAVTSFMTVLPGSSIRLVDRSLVAVAQEAARAGPGRRVQVVRRLGVDDQVDAADLVLLVDPEADGPVDHPPDDARHRERVDEHHCRGQHLLAQLVDPTAVEEP